MEKYKHIHFIGISGIGMSGIARILLESGYKVSGSDLASSRITNNLKELGAKVYRGHHKDNLSDCDVVVVSTAVPSDNPELIEAKRRKIPIIQRAEMLDYLMKSRFGIAVAGTHGKTTTTSMVAKILENAKLDPTVVVGGELNDIGSNAKLGYGKFLVAEADESDASFLSLNPRLIVITNIDTDVNFGCEYFSDLNFDHKSILNKAIELFKEFIHKLPPKGKAVLCIDDKSIQRILSSIKRDYLTYGFKKDSNLTARDIVLKSFSSVCDVIHKGKNLGKLKLKVPGRFNILNALAAIGVGLELGLDFILISKSLSKYEGVQRRFQILGEVSGVIVIDDYAHNPVKIKAALEAARTGKYKRIIAIFQPHRYTRTKFFLNEFISTFNDADLLIVTDIYSATEEPIKGVDSKKLIELIKKNNSRGEVIYIPDKDQIPDYILKVCQKGDLIITLGAGDINKVGFEILDQLEKHKMCS